MLRPGWPQKGAVSQDSGSATSSGSSGGSSAKSDKDKSTKPLRCVCVYVSLSLCVCVLVCVFLFLCVCVRDIIVVHYIIVCMYMCVRECVLEYNLFLSRSSSGGQKRGEREREKGFAGVKPKRSSSRELSKEREAAIRVSV